MTTGLDEIFSMLLMLVLVGGLFSVGIALAILEWLGLVPGDFEHQRPGFKKKL